ncbi:hypothetical protein [Rhizobacter sp. Root404]|uniref:hypothetical protein n=1 Tax=Rhizobacter sp. Root404 TaxID=1736528 RepID=UPI0006F24CC3|nr:hypothetical protein [Rhizobacter sp. Root404]KQW36555.1 hypothetical protein ASC76_18010 [Rhizobacter sp. Root404]
MADVTDCIASMVLENQALADTRTTLLPALSALFAVERTLLGDATIQLDADTLDHLGNVAESEFEDSYGHGELAVERRNW